MADVFTNLGIALALGLLVGFQRELTSAGIAGIRTFALITLFGALCGTLAAQYGSWLVIAGLVAVTVIMVLGNLMGPRGGQQLTGMTTEVAALVMFLVGAAVPTGYKEPAVVTAAAVAVLRHAKEPLHGLVRRVGAQESEAVFRLVLIGLVILPVLPDRAYGPYGVLNPYRIWLLVVLIVGVSLVAYVVSRALGPAKGTLALGLLGGLISSTAATVGYARGTRSGLLGPRTALLLLGLSSTIVFVRVLGEIWLVAPDHVAAMAPPLLVVMAALAILSALAWLAARREPRTGTAGPPSELKGAIAFGLLYAVVLLAVAFARETFGQRGLYVVAVISGLTDVDAITLSTAQLVAEGRVAPEAGSRAVLLGVMANLVFKAGVVGALGTRGLLARTCLLFGGACVAGSVVLAVW